MSACEVVLFVGDICEEEEDEEEEEVCGRFLINSAHIFVIPI